MENLELYKHIYKDCEMSIFSLDTLLDDIKEKDNKIKNIIEDIRGGYERYFNEVTKLLDGDNPKKTGMMAKVGASMGISKEVKEDNSDASIADMLIKGVSMGVLDMEKKIKDYEDKIDKKELNFAKDFLKFQHETISGLKKFL